MVKIDWRNMPGLFKEDLNNLELSRKNCISFFKYNKMNVSVADFIREMSHYDLNRMLYSGIIIVMNNVIMKLRRDWEINKILTK